MGEYEFMCVCICVSCTYTHENIYTYTHEYSYTDLNTITNGHMRSHARAYTRFLRCIIS